MKSDITVPLSLVVAAIATFIGHAAIQYTIYGNDPMGFFAFRFLGAPAIAILLVFIPAAIVLALRLVRHRRAVRLRRRAAYGWLGGTLIVLGLLATMAFVRFDLSGYGFLFLLYFTPIALLISSVVGILMMLVLTTVLYRQRGTETEQLLRP
ncbi:hypothetical protein SAMN06295879_0421 [Agreia bicolorata]|uniref:Uncharacterized protein n=1 Tax=Agreia bicolorata TaxID=110935 RepID=A0A1T4WY02_9MICO|nr:hypothetical protein [Agreia bicolorata]SKA82037.1 hypothetical protein SAMN06295879_0421 [Agreia bicolorata]